MDNETAEEWRPIAGYPGYFVSNLGRVRRDIQLSRILKPTPRNQNPRFVPYLSVRLSHKGKATTRNIHDLVTTAFHGPRPTPIHQAAHGPSGAQDNAATNLRWATPKENMADRVTDGTSSRGSQSANAKLSEDQVKAIREKLSDGHSQNQLAALYSVSREAIADIKQRRTWGWL